MLVSFELLVVFIVISLLTVFYVWRFFYKNRINPDPDIHVLIICVKYTSHYYWCKTYSKYSNHTISIMYVDGSYFKWKMQSGCIGLAQKFIQIFIDKDFITRFADKNNSNKLNIECKISVSKCPDVIIIDDLIDLNVFAHIVDINNKMNKTIKYIYYMHENQLSYPWNNNDRSKQNGTCWMYGYQNYKSMIGSHQIWWNSKYHLNNFCKNIISLIKNKSNNNDCDLDVINYVKYKSLIMYIPLDFNQIDSIINKSNNNSKIKQPIILWNARWESDKNPKLFLFALRHIKKMKNISFKLVILGESFTHSKSEIFNTIYNEFKNDILQFGYVSCYSEYILWLKLSDIIVMTSNHEFFGISLIETIYCCNTFPILPNKLVYPEHFKDNHILNCFYKSKGELVKNLITVINYIMKCKLQNKSEYWKKNNIFKKVALKYDAEKISMRYDDTITALLNGNR